MSSRVFIVDHQAQIRKLVRSFLFNEFGFQICGEAASGYEAITKVPILKPDLVVLEVSTPGLNGIEAAPKFRKLLPRTLIILFTNYGHLLRAFDAREIGVDAVVSKNDGMSALGNSINLLFGQPRNFKLRLARGYQI
jgi:DNA-binding NarL/FixJ family response regulator